MWFSNPHRLSPQCRWVTAACGIDVSVSVSILSEIWRLTLNREASRSVVRSALLAIAGVAGLVSLFVSLGPTKLVVAVAGFVLALAMLQWPIIGLVLVVLTGTCFQVLGSGPITGLPVSLGKLFGVITLGAWLFRSTADRSPWTYSPQLLALLAYIAAMCLNGLLVHPTDPSPENGFMRFFQIIVVFWLTANIAGMSRRNLLIYAGSLSAGLAISEIIGGLEHFVPTLSIESDDPALLDGAIGAVVDHDSLAGVDLKRITGGSGNSNYLADTIIAVLPLKSVLALVCARLRSTAARIGYCRLTAVGAGAVVYPSGFPRSRRRRRLSYLAPGHLGPASRLGRRGGRCSGSDLVAARLCRSRILVRVPRRRQYADAEGSYRIRAAIRA